MPRKLVPLAAAATISMTAMAPVAISMGMYFNMLSGVVLNKLKSPGLPFDDINDPILSQLTIIKVIVDGDVSEGQKRQNIRAIIIR